MARKLTYREIAESDRKAGEFAVLVAMLYDLVAFLFGWPAQRHRRKLRERREGAQALKREARRARRDEQGRKGP